MFWILPVPGTIGSNVVMFSWLWRKQKRECSFELAAWMLAEAVADWTKEVNLISLPSTLLLPRVPECFNSEVFCLYAFLATCPFNGERLGQFLEYYYPLIIKCGIRNELFNDSEVDIFNDRMQQYAEIASKGRDYAFHALPKAFMWNLNGLSDSETLGAEWIMSVESAQIWIGNLLIGLAGTVKDMDVG